MTPRVNLHNPLTTQVQSGRGPIANYITVHSSMDTADDASGIEFAPCVTITSLPPQLGTFIQERSSGGTSVGSIIDSMDDGDLQTLLEQTQECIEGFDWLRDVDDLGARLNRAYELLGGSDATTIELYEKRADVCRQLEALGVLKCMLMDETSIDTDVPMACAYVAELCDQIVRARTGITPEHFMPPDGMNKLKKAELDAKMYYVNMANSMMLLRGPNESDYLYRPKFTEDNLNTFIYEPYMQYTEFVATHSKYTERGALWSIVSNTKVTGEIAKYLQTHCELDIYSPQRGVLSFNDGVYNTRTATFVPRSECPSSCYASQYINENMGPHALKEVAGVPGLYRQREFDELVLPDFDHIVTTTQRFSSNERLWLLAMIGRLFRPANVDDSWESILFLTGIGGSGKSSIVTLVQNLFPMSHCGVLGNDSSSFTIENLLGVHIVVNTECKDLGGLSESAVLKMASSDSIKIDRKNKTSVTVPRWEAPIVFAGNNGFQLSDGQSDGAGALGRRVVYINFATAPQVMDGSIKKRLLGSNIAQFVHASCSAYKLVTQIIKYQSDCWRNLPQRFIDMRHEVEEQHKPVLRFIRDASVIVLGSDLKMPFTIFKRIFKDWLALMSRRKSVDWTQREQYCYILDECGIREVTYTEPEEWNSTYGRAEAGVFLVGCTLTEPIVDKLTRGERMF